MAGGLSEEMRAVIHCAAFRIWRGIIDAAQTRERDRPRAHGARLQCHIKIATDEPLRAYLLAGLTNGQQFGMGRRVTVGHGAVACHRQHRPLADNDSPHRHLTHGGGLPGGIKGQAQGISFIISRHRLDFPLHLSGLLCYQDA